VDLSLSTPTATLTYLNTSELLVAIFNDAAATEEPKLAVG
jgi:hypothetical protein